MKYILSLIFVLTTINSFGQRDGAIYNHVGYHIFSDTTKSKIIGNLKGVDCKTNLSKVTISFNSSNSFLRDVRKGCDSVAHLEIRGDTTILIMKLIDHFYDYIQENGQEIRERDEMIRLCVDYINSLNIDSKTQNKDKKFQSYQREIKKFGYHRVVSKYKN